MDTNSSSTPGSATAGAGPMTSSSSHFVTTASNDSGKALATDTTILPSTSSLAMNDDGNPDTSQEADDNGTTVTFPPGPLRTFTCLPDLCPELRIRIWRFASFYPRFIEVSENPVLFGPLKDRNAFELTLNKYTVPSILQVNKESRTEGLKHYQLCGGHEYELLHSAGKLILPPTNYINLDCDFIGPEFFSSCFTMQGMRYVNKYNFRRIYLCRQGIDFAEIFIPFDFDRLNRPEGFKLDEIVFYGWSLAGIYARSGVKVCHFHEIPGSDEHIVEEDVRQLVVQFETFLDQQEEAHKERCEYLKRNGRSGPFPSYHRPVLKVAY